MNVLLGAMRRTLAELDLGLKGDLTMSEPMEKLMLSLASDQVPTGKPDLPYLSAYDYYSNLFSKIVNLCHSMVIAHIWECIQLETCQLSCHMGMHCNLSM